MSEIFHVDLSFSRIAALEKKILKIFCYIYMEIPVVAYPTPWDA
jgi:hypothetical protein